MAQTPQQIKLKSQMREAVSSAYVFIRSRQYTESISNLTYEELIDAAIDRIEGGPGTFLRGTELDQIKKIKDELGTAVETIKKFPPEYWQFASDDRIDLDDAVNTEE
jgi:hypothetical protein